MNSLQFTTSHTEPTTINTICKPNENADDDNDDVVTATTILMADQTGNNGDCSRNERAPPNTHNDEEENEEEVDDGENDVDDDEDMDHSTMMMATHNQLAQHGFGLHLEVDDGMAASAITMSSRPTRTNRRPGKVEFVRFDSKETVYLTEPNEENGSSNHHHQHELVRNKIKEEIKR